MNTFTDFSTVQGIMQRTGCNEAAAKKFRAAYLRLCDSTSLHYAVAGHGMDGIELSLDNAQREATRLARASKRNRQ